MRNAMVTNTPSHIVLHPVLIFVYVFVYIIYIYIYKIYIHIMLYI